MKRKVENRKSKCSHCKELTIPGKFQSHYFCNYCLEFFNVQQTISWEKIGMNRAKELVKKSKKIIIDLNLNREYFEYEDQTKNDKI